MGVVDIPVMDDLPYPAPWSWNIHQDLPFFNHPFVVGTVNTVDIPQTSGIYIYIYYLPDFMMKNILRVNEHPSNDEVMRK